MTVHTEHSMEECNMEEGNFDIVISTAPASAVGVGNTLFVTPRLTKRLREIAVACAATSNRHLHHAEFVVTDEADYIDERVSVHDCATCRAGADQAKAHLRDKKADKVLVGSIWYVPE